VCVWTYATDTQCRRVVSPTRGFHKSYGRADAKVLHEEEYSPMKCPVKREALEKMNRQANEMRWNSGTSHVQ